MAEKKTPNPNGRKGSPEHQEKVAEVAQNIFDRGLNFIREFFERTPDGKKRGRFVDIVAIDPNTQEVVEYHQVGKVNKDGTPVKRERLAMEDLEQKTGKKTIFHVFIIVLLIIGTIGLITVF